MNKIFGWTLAATMLAAVPAYAQEAEHRFYLGGFVGDRFGKGETFEGANLAGAPRVIETPTKDNVLAGVILGAIVHQGSWGRMRVEGEFSASRNSLSKLVLNGVERDLLQGRKSVTAGMINAIYDTPKIANLIRFSIGGGVGSASIDYDIRYNVSTAGPAINIPTSVSKVGYQGIVGASVSVTPRVELTADFRYFKIANHEVERFNATAGTLDSVLKADYDSTAATIGARFFF